MSEATQNTPKHNVQTKKVKSRPSLSGHVYTPNINEIGHNPHTAYNYGNRLGFNHKNKTEFINAIREGFDFSAVESLSNELELNVNDLAGYADITQRTFSRRKKEGRLHSDESDRLARIAMIFEDVMQLFEGDRKHVLQWLRSPKKALDGAIPIEYIDTELGVQEVRDLIGRIEHGVFS